MTKHQYKTIWISDIHLGSKGCKSEYLLSFLKSVRCENLYLLGDIIDGWRLSYGRSYWPQEHVNVVRRVLTMAKKNTKVIYITGNHDEFLRKYTKFNLEMGNVKIVNKAVYTSVNGKKYWCIHGDTFDNITTSYKWLAHFGDKGYNSILYMNTKVNSIRKKLGLKYWNISAYLKHKAKTAVNFIYDFENNISSETKRRGYDGVFCGHIHNCEIKEINGITYFNTGDWVESCTAIVEHYDGRIEAIYWGDGSNPKILYTQ